MDPHLELLSQCFLNTFSPSPEPRRAAEAKLFDLSDQANFALAVLNLVALESTDEPIRHAAAVHFKNHLKSHWSLAPDSSATPIPDSEKHQIKSSIVSLMITSPPRIQSQLSEALTIIGSHDFPKQWASLLPELVANLQAKILVNDYVSINGILRTADSIFKKFCYQYKTNELLIDLKHCLDGFAKPLLCVFQHTAGLIDSTSAAAVGTANAVTSKLLFESQRLCCRIFYSLNFQELPEFFEDHMREWMTEFQKYLTTSYPLEAMADGMALVDNVRAAVCDNISLYMEKNEEEFKEFLEGFMVAVWKLLLSVSQSASRDRLAITSMKFLTTVSTSVHYTLFGRDGVIPQICQGIVIPNVRLRNEDEELFEMNYVEFIRRDMEGSDLDTRRRIACELLKGIGTNHRQQVTRMVSVEVQNLLGSYTASPTVNWKDKDCAIYLVVSLALKKSGGTSVTTDLVDVDNFFSTVIIPELQSQDVNSYPLLKAGALKFITTFRSLIPKPFATTLFQELIRFLVAESNVVHSYAATCIEKLLLVKEEDGRARYNSSDIAPFLGIVMTNLFNALKLPESEENQYVMKCIMRVIGTAEIYPEAASFCISGLTNILAEVCKNPKNPIFNHYLFESVASLVRRACERDTSLVSNFETSLFPSIQAILANDVAEFLPYAFQLLAQLVDLSKPPLSSSYMHIFTLLLSPDSWKRKSNVPALVSLLQAFLRKAPHEINQEGRLSQVLGIFNNLISTPSTEEQGFYVLNTVIENLDFGAIAPYVVHIWNALFLRLQNKRTVKFVKSFIIVMSLFCIKHDSSKLIETMNAVQPNIFSVILEQFWIPNLKLITGHIEVKLAAVSSTKLICECPILLDPAATKLWGKMLDSIVTLLSQPEEKRIEDEPDVPDVAENTGYTVSFATLYGTGKKEEDPLNDIKDPKEFLALSLAKLSTLSPGRYPHIIGENIDATSQSALLDLCRAYNCSVV